MTTAIRINHFLQTQHMEKPYPLEKALTDKNKHGFSAAEEVNAAVYKDFVESNHGLLSCLYDPVFDVHQEWEIFAATAYKKYEEVAFNIYMSKVLDVNYDKHCDTDKLCQELKVKFNKEKLLHFPWIERLY